MLVVYLLISLLILRFLKHQRKHAVKQCVFICPIPMNHVLYYLYEVVERFDSDNYYLHVIGYPDGQVNLSICIGKEESQGIYRNFVKFSNGAGRFCFSLDKDCKILLLHSKGTFFENVHKRHIAEIDEIVQIISSINYMYMMTKNEEETGAYCWRRTSFFIRY